MLDLDAEGASGLLQFERRPVAGAMLPFRLERDRDPLLDQFAANGVADERGVEEALGEAGGDGVHLVTVTVFSFIKLSAILSFFETEPKFRRDLTNRMLKSVRYDVH